MPITALLTILEPQIIKNNSRTIIILEGDLDVSTGPFLWTDLKKMIDKGEVNILLDFKNIAYIKQSCLSVFIVADRLARSKGGKIEFKNTKIKMN